MDDKILQALARTLKDSEPPTAIRKKRRVVHVVETLQNMLPPSNDDTQHNNNNNNNTYCDHVVFVVTVNDMMAASKATAIATAEPPLEARDQSTQHNHQENIIWDHPLLQSEILNHISNPKDAILLGRLTVVLLIPQNQEDPTTLDLMRAASNRGKSTSVFICRPDEPPSCYNAARILWSRLEKGQRT